MTIDPTTLTFRRREGEERTVKTGRREKRSVNLKTYDVLTADGVQIGIVFQEMQTFEKVPFKGARYVSRRWESPRWFYYVGTQNYGRRSSYNDTRQQAVSSLLWAIKLEQETKDAG